MMNMRCNRYVTVKAPIWVNRTVGSKDASVSRVPREKSVYLFRQPAALQAFCSSKTTSPNALKRWKILQEPKKCVTNGAHSSDTSLVLERFSSLYLNQRTLRYRGQRGGRRTCSRPSQSTMQTSGVLSRYNKKADDITSK